LNRNLQNGKGQDTALQQRLARCAARGVDIKWFGGEEPVAFTSRYDSWHYLGELNPLPKTIRVLSTTCDMRVPLIFSEQDCRDIVDIIAEEAAINCNRRNLI
jgi:hypothetical protein